MSQRGTTALIAALFCALALAAPSLVGAQASGPRQADAGVGEPTITSTDQSMRVELPNGETLELNFAEVAPSLEKRLVKGPRSLLKSAGCDPYMYRYAGYAPIDPASHASLGLPPIDADCDGQADRPWYIERRLDWHSVDSRLGAVDMTDVKAVIIRMRSRRGGSTTTTLFAAVDSDGEAIGGYVQQRDGEVWGEALVGRHGQGRVHYRLFAAAAEPLSVAVLESGTPLADGQIFDRAVVLTAGVVGGTGGADLGATIDGSSYTLGDSYGVEGFHSIEITATTGTETATASATFAIDFSPPSFNQLEPPNGALLGTPAVTVSGLVSADAVFVTVAGTPAILGSPTADWRSLTSIPLVLVEGGNTLALHAEDGVGRTTDQDHHLVVDSLPPDLAVTSPPNGFVTGDPHLTVSGSAVDPNLGSVTVNGVAATFGGGSFTAVLALVEGANPITVVAADALGHASEASLSVTLDTMPPTLNVFESGAEFADELLLGRPAVITVESSDSTDVQVAAAIDGEPYILGTPYAAGGAHSIVVTATDEAGNSATATRSFTIDNNPPLVDDLTPVPGTVYAALAIDIAGRVSDDAVEVTVGAVSAIFGGAGSGWIGWTAQGVALEQDGLNLIPLRAVDAAGNVTELELSYDRDTAAPQVSVNAPAEGLITRFENLTVSGVATDAHLDRVTVNGVEVAFAADGSFSQAVVLVEGANTITVTAVDVVFGETTIFRTITLDTAPPVITVTNGGVPLADDMVSAEPVTPVIEAADETAVTLTITLNGSPFVSATPVSSEGSYVLVISAEDAAGNTATLERSFNLDLTPPVLGGLSLVDGSVLADPSPLLTGACDDAVAVAVDGQPAVITAGTFSYAGVALSEGANTMTVVAADDVGNQSTVTLNITLDTTGPVLSVRAPNDGALVGEASVTVIGSAEDPHLESVTVAGREAALAGSAFQVQTPLAQEGANVITVVAVDRAGNSSELTLTVERDTTAPLLTIDEPGPSAILGSATVTVTGSVTDAHDVMLSVDSRPVIPGGDGSFTIDLQLPEGAHSLITEATDEVGNRSSISREISVDLSAPELQISAPSAGAILAVTTVTVTGTVSDALGTDRVTVNGRDAAIDDVGGFELIDLVLEEGANTIVARAWDTAGNSGTRSIEIQVDTVAPSVVSTVPVDGTSAVPTTARPRVRFSEPINVDSMIGRIRLSRGGEQVEVALSTVGDGEEVDVAPMGGLADNAEHLLEVDSGVTDRAGHPLEAAVSAAFTTVDSTPPQPPILDSITSPACLTSLLVSGVAEAESTVLATGDVQPSSTAAGTDGSFALELEPAAGEGAIEVEVVAEDVAGNRSQPAYLVIELDCTAPQVNASEWDGDTAITVRFSEELDAATVVVGHSVVVDGSLSPLAFTTIVTGGTIAVELTAAPPVEELPLRLDLTADITDLAGNPATPYSQLFADPATATFVAGEVFSDSDSGELAGARVILEEDGGPVPGEPPTVTADGRGRYQIPVIFSPVVIRVEAEGHLPTWRRAVPVPGAATLLFDVRLSERADPVTVDATTYLETTSARLSVDGASVPEGGFDLELSRISEQGLPGLLPFGWRPLAAAHVGLPDAITLDPPAVLDFTTNIPPEAVIARYDVASHAWVSEAFGGTVDVANTATFALIAADVEPTSPGVAVLGSVLPAADAADPGVMSASLQLEPPVILPMETSLATVTTVPTTAAPSGHPVEARLDEVLHVADGGVLVAPPVAIDLFLYRQPDDTLAARFDLGASEAARRIALDEGVKTVNIRTLPDEVRTQDLVGPAGANLLSTDGVGLEVPENALDRVVGVELAGQPLDLLPIALPAGLEAVAAANLGLGGLSLSIPATLTFAGEGEPGFQYLLLSPVEVDGNSHWRLIGLGALENERIVCGPTQLGALPAPGVLRAGLYVVARSTGEAWGLLTGTVIDVDFAPATETCLVSATGGIVQVTEGDGVYALAAPAGTIDLIAEQLVSRNTGELTAAATAGTVTEDVDIQLEVVPPRVIATSPIDGADKVSTATPITVDFSEPLDLEPDNLWGIEVLVVAGPVNEPGVGDLDLTANGTRLTWIPSASFPSASRIHVTVDGNLRDLQGNLLEGGDHVFEFGVERYIGNEDIDESKLRLFVPGRDPSQPELAVVEGEDGAVPADIWMFIEDLDHDAPVTTFQATGLGAFTTSLEMFDPDRGTGVQVGDRLRLHILDSDDSNDELYVVELKPWLTADGLGAFFNIDGGEFVTTEGVGVNAPWGAFPDTGSLRASLLDHADVLPSEYWPSFAEARGAARLELTVEAARTLQLVIPGDAPTNSGTTMHACMRIDVAGRPHPMLMRTARWDAELQAYVTSPADDELPEDAAKALEKAATTGNPDPLLPGLRRSMEVVILEPTASFSKSSTVTDLKGRLLIAKGKVEGNVEVKAMFLDASASVVYANTFYAPSDAALVAYDFGGPSKAYGDPTGGYAVLGMQEALTPGSGATVPLRPDDDFELHVTDPDTGFTYSERGYPAPAGGDFVDIPLSDAPGVGDEQLRIVGATPFILFSFDASVGRTPLTHLIEVNRENLGSPVTCRIPAGALPADRRVVLINLETGVQRTATTPHPGGADVSLSMAAGIGEPMLLVVEPLLSSGDQRLTLRFNRPAEGLVIPEHVQLLPVGNAATDRLHLDTEGDTIRLTPDPIWEADSRYDLRLTKTLFASLGATLPQEPVDLPIKVAGVVADEPVMDAIVADAALEGDVLLVAARDSGLRTFDISDPTTPRLLSTTEGLGAPAAGVASDGFGHVITLEGRINEHVVLRLRLLDELIEGGVDPVDFRAHLPLSEPLTSVGPGDLELEVFAERVDFNAAEPGDDIIVTLNQEGDGWESVTVAAELLTANHPVLLHDGITGRVLRRVPAPADGDLTIRYDELELEPGEDLSLAHPLRLRAHSATLVWAHASAGPLLAAAVTIGEGDAYDFSIGGIAQNAGLLDWIIGPGEAGTCRILGAADSVYLGRLAVTPRRDGGATVLAASRYEGVWGFGQTSSSPDLVPDWIECVRGGGASDLADVASATWTLTDTDGRVEETNVVAVVGHRRLEVFEIGAHGGLDLLAGFDVGWDPFRVALDALDHLIVVRDNASHLAVFSLTRRDSASSWSLGQVADIVLPEGSGLGPLVLDPDHGIAITGTAPVQYKPPVIELVADSDDDGVRERVEYLQPLGAPEAPPGPEGEKPPYLAWVTARIVGVPDDVGTMRVRVEGLAPGGGVLPLRPEPFLPSSTVLELKRNLNLALDDPGRNHFVSTRPILLIADERARTYFWKNIEQSLRAELAEETEADARYALCRNCGRDFDGNGDADLPSIPWGEAAIRPDAGSFGLQPGLEPVELAAAGRLRVTLEIDGTTPGWLAKLKEEGMAPAAEVVSLPWMPSPPIGREPGIEVRAAVLPEVELATGALTLGRTDLVLPAPGMDIVLGRQYSSAGIRFGLFGRGWELAGLDRLRPNPDGTVDLYTSSGDRFVFGKPTDGNPQADTTRPTSKEDPLTSWAHPAELKPMTGGGWFILTPDGGWTEFSPDGYPMVIRDRYRLDKSSGSEIRFLWHADGTLAQVEQRNGKHSTDLKPRALTFRYGEQYTDLDGGEPPPGLITSVEDSTGRTYLYTYDASGWGEKAGIKGIKLNADGSTGNIIESYEKDPAGAGAPPPMDLEWGAQLNTVQDAKMNLVLDATWVDGRVQGVTRGESGGESPPIVTTVEPISKTEWTVTEGVTPAGQKTVTQLSLVEEGDGWQSEIVVGTGDDATTTTAILDRDGRVRSVEEPGGITTVTVPNDGARRFSFLPKTVTTNAGSVGEPASTGQLITRYDYQNGQIKRIERPGPVAPIVTRILRSNEGRTIVTVAPDESETTRYLDELGRAETQVSSTGSESALSYDDDVNGSGELRQSVMTSAVGTSTTTIGRNALGQAESSRTFSTTADDGPVPPERFSRTESNSLGWTLLTQAGRTTTRTLYDAAGRIQSIVSGEDGGRETTTVPGYTKAGMISGITRSQGLITETNRMSYDDAGRLWTSEKAGVTTNYVYDSAGRTSTRTESWMEPGADEETSLTTGYTYEPATGRLIATTTPGGKEWTNHFDTLGRQVGRSDPAGVRETLVLGADGRLGERKLTTGEAEESVLWAWEEFGYDEIGRQRTRTVHRFPVTPEPDPAQARALTTTTEYFDEPGPKLGLVEWIEDPLNRKTLFDYDDAGREIERELPDGSKIETTYHPDGKVYKRKVRFDGDEPWALTTTTVYDDQGRVFQVIDPGGRTTTTFYDELGRKQQVLAPDSVPDESGEQSIERLTFWTYGDLGRVVTETRPDGAAVTRTYDERGNLVAYEDHEGNTTQYHYFLNGRLKAIEYPDGTVRSFTYYDDGEMHKITRADDTIVTFIIDPDTGRLKTVTASEHQPGGSVTFDYDTVGHLTSAYDDDAILGFSWDSVGNQLSESLALPGLGFDEREVTRGFDDGNRPEILGMPDGLPELVRAYDEGDRLVGLTVDEQPLWGAHYDGGRLARIDRANGLVTTLGYDSEGRPIDVRTGAPEVDDLIPAPIHRLAFGWTDASLRRSKGREDTRRIIERFHYDGVGHLESDLGNGNPAVMGVDSDLAAALPGLDSRRVEDWWTVNLVDELEARRRVADGNQIDFAPEHDPEGLHQVIESGNFSYDWDDNGNLEARHLMQGETTVATDTFNHDWRDRLVGVEQGSSSTTLIVDPLGRLVAKVRDGFDGAVRRVYLHDGDQVVAEYVQEAGGTAWQPERRHHWGRWIDDLAVEQVDTDGDGVLDETLYPITDLLGSEQLLTGESGEIVERVEYQTDGTPRFFGEDVTPPSAVRVAWTGDGVRPTGDAIEAGAFKIGFDELLEEASAENAVATVTPGGGGAVTLSVALDDDGRGVTLSASVLESGTSYALHLEGMRDRSGNDMWELDLSFTVGDSTAYETLLDAGPPSVLAVLDAADGLYLLFDEPMVSVGGADIADAVSVKRGAGVVAGSTERLGSQLFKWTADEGAPWYPQQRYEITQIQLEDLAATPNTVATLPEEFTHIATFPGQVLIAYSKPDHSTPLAQSRYGLTSLFQGRTWHEELGLYYFRARWYGVDLLSFTSRDPAGYMGNENLKKAFGFNPVNKIDPKGLYEIDFHYYAVYYLARSAGYPSTDASKLAWASQFVDDSKEISGPKTLSEERLFSFHFLSESRKGYVHRENPRAYLNVMRALNTRSLIGLGISLHTWADTYAHEGFQAGLNLAGWFGHIYVIPIGKSPDAPWRDTRKTVQAAYTTFGLLSEESIRSSRTPQSWWSILGKVSSGFSWREGLEARKNIWKVLIMRDFGENPIYEKYEAAASWIDEFEYYAAAQREYVTGRDLGIGRRTDVDAPGPPNRMVIPEGLSPSIQ